jgi:hypothetical protein
MGGGATDYALAKNVSVGDESYEWPAGSIVEVICAADEIAQLFADAAAAIHDNVAGEIVAVTEKTTPIAADELLIEDSADANNKKSVKLSNLVSAGLAGHETVSRTIYVNADSGDDDTGDGTNGNEYETFSKALSMVEATIDDNVTVTILLESATATYTPVDTGRLCLGSGELVIAGELTDEESATADSGTATTLTDTGAFTGDTWAGYLLEITGGTGSGQFRIIRTHTNDVLTVVGRFSTSPDNTSTYTIHGWGTKLDGATGWYFTLGAITVQDLSSPTTTVSALLWPVNNVNLSCERLSIKATAATQVIYGGPVSAFEMDTCDLNGNSQNYRALTVVGLGQYSFYRTWIHGFTGSSQLWTSLGEGALVVVRAGCYIDGSAGSGAVIGIDAGGFFRFFCSSRNGAIDKIDIVGDAGNTYGLYAQKGGGGLLATAANINFTGSFSVANTGADASTMGWIET